MYRKMIQTPLGNMCALACDSLVCELFFSDEALEEKSSPIFDQLEKELGEYFEKKRKELTVPFSLQGTSFQNKVWNELLRVPYGQTKSYGDIAKAIDAQGAQRAVAAAIGQNKIAILVPCHRVIYQNSTLGGYRWGQERKKWLLEHEKEFLF